MEIQLQPETAEAAVQDAAERGYSNVAGAVEFEEATGEKYKGE